jgi:hypothetical protein
MQLKLLASSKAGQVRLAGVARTVESRVLVRESSQIADGRGVVIGAENSILGNEDHPDRSRIFIKYSAVQYTVQAQKKSEQNWEAGGNVIIK